MYRRNYILTRQIIMQLTQQIIDHFKFEEGYKTHAYLDTEGYYTVGYGHMLGRDPSYADVVWTDEECLAALATDLDSSNNGVHNIFEDYDAYSDGVQLALLDMCYELGEHGLSGFHLFIRYVKARDWETAATEALDSLWAREVPHRAKRDTDLIASG